MLMMKCWLWSWQLCWWWNADDDTHHWKTRESAVDSRLTLQASRLIIMIIMIRMINNYHNEDDHQQLIKWSQNRVGHKYLWELGLGVEWPSTPMFCHNLMIITNVMIHHILIMMIIVMRRWVVKFLREKITVTKIIINILSLLSLFQYHYCCHQRWMLNAKTAYYLTLVYGILKLFLGVGKGNALMTIIRYVSNADHYDHGKRGHG